MNALQNYLIDICRAYLKNRQMSLSDDVDYDALYRLANTHNLSGIVFCVLNTASNSYVVPREAFKRFESDFLEAVVRYDFQKAQIDEISALCRENEIKHVFFKGATIRDLFPVPEARVMGDVDILIYPNDANKLEKLLTAHDFRCKNAGGNVYEYTKGGLLTEAHTKIISGRIGAHDLEGAFENAMDFAAFDGARGTLDDTYHFAYLLAHLAHHFWFYGAGVKLILDLAVLLTQCTINLDKVLTLLQPCGLDAFARVMLTVTHKWFGCGRDFGMVIDETELFLLSFGAFGNAGRNRAAVLARKDMESGGSGKGFGAKWRLLFPGYEKMKQISYIRFIDGRPYLLPAAWVYRIFYNMKNRRAFVKNATKTLGSDETKKDALQEMAFFEEIGLL